MEKRQRVRRKPTKLDREVYMKYGQRGDFSVDELLGDYETVDYNSLREARTDNLELGAESASDLHRVLSGEQLAPPKRRQLSQAEAEAQERFDRLLAAKGVVPREESDSVMMTFTGDEMQESSENSESSEVLSVLSPTPIDWEKQTAHTLAHSSTIAFFGAHSYDEDLDMQLSELFGRDKSMEKWLNIMEARLGTRQHSSIDAGHGQIVHFAYDNYFVALYLIEVMNRRIRLVNYFYIKAR